MRNIFLFIRRYFNFIFFLLLQVFCIYLIVHYNRYHNAIASVYVNEVTGRVNEQYNKVDYYLQLKKANQQLVKENERLRNTAKADFETPDTSVKVVTDSIPYDTLGNHRKWAYQAAKVVSNSVTSQSNFIVLGRGAAQQLKKDEGVIDTNNGVVGIVTDVSDNFAVVMSMLHKDSRINALLKNDPQGGGTIVWDGKEPNYLSMINVRKSAKVAKGDTVVTSGITTTFPYGLMIGTVEEVLPEKSSNNYIIKIKSTANFYNLQHVYAIDNYQREEINKLVEKAKSKINN
ncbi:MAG: mreC [Ferruginibacter sp.]|jgi:rod shape-determining protein MreC|uniref:rod shape-determining protein MreC n=1 Tax=Ferruginibacter sp. TaxID=1940288 RepID=UPI0026592709|nr:rod shape-determining protein MreC [Ferruginibacter sp.]MDB5280414.1 mreC [Ferruginibacter sp.]